MATDKLHGIVDELRRSLLRHDGAGLTDGELLSRYIELREDESFAALVRRHSPLVWGICDRLIGHYHDTEDAFQSTFFVAARKAAGIKQRDMFANWLYGAAHRTALKTRALTRRRRAREKQVRVMPEPPTQKPDPWPDLVPLIDQEIARLPDKYRIAIVLCDLEGKTGREVARRLQLPEGTVSSRLKTARAMLAKRLARHGFTLSAGAVAAVLSQNALSACAPAMVVSNTTKAALLYAAGKVVAPSIVSIEVVAITRGVLKVMLLHQLKIPAAIMATLAVLGLSLGAVFQGGPQPVAGVAANPPPRQKPAKIAEPAPGAPAQPKPKQPEERQADQRPRDVIQPGDRLKINASTTPNSNFVQGVFMVEPTGKVALGGYFSRVELAGKTLEQAEQIILDLAKTMGVARDPQVTVTRYFTLDSPASGDFQKIEQHLLQLESGMRELQKAVDRLEKKLDK